MPPIPSTPTRRLSIALFLVVLLTGQSLAALFGPSARTQSAPGISTAGVDAASEFLERIRQGQHITGMSAAVWVKGQIACSIGLGFADAESGIAAAPDTRYRAGSVSKVLTTAALARLYEEGRLDLDADIRDLVPEFPDKGSVVTVRHLAGHLAGIRHYRMGETEAPKKPYSDVVKALELFAQDPLLHAPGEKWAYSSFGYTLISAAIQRAAGQPFQDYMRSEVFGPLGMPDTDVEELGVEDKNLARLYDHGKPIARNDISYIWAGGGFLSTAVDLVRFGSAFLPGAGFISDRTLELLSTNQVTNSGEEVDHGIGWMADREPDGDHVIYHGGTIRGGHSVLYIEPGEQVVVAILANEAAGFGLTEAYIVASQILGRTDPPRFIRDAANLKVRRENREKLFGALDRFEAAIEAGDLGATMALLADDFTSSRWADKSAARSGLGAWFATGPVEFGGDLDIGIRGVHRGATSDISGVEIGLAGRIESITLIFSKQVNDEWLLTEILWR